VLPQVPSGLNGIDKSGAREKVRNEGWKAAGALPLSAKPVPADTMKSNKSENVFMMPPEGAFQ
jgi:hypothetical protein